MLIESAREIYLTNKKYLSLGACECENVSLNASNVDDARPTKTTSSLEFRQETRKVK